MLLKKSISLILVCLLLLNQLAFSQVKKTNVAVLDFDGRGISKMEAGTLTDRLRSELVKSGSFSIVDRGKMESILNEIGFQQTGCTSAECAVEAGRILNVQKMVAGTIGKVGQTFTIDILFIDVESGKIEKSYSRNYRGEVDGLLSQLKELADEMSGKTEPQDSKPVYEQQKPQQKPEQATAKIIESEKKSSKTWLWITGGLVVAGAAAAYLLLGGDGDNPDNGGLPDPDTIWPPSSR